MILDNKRGVSMVFVIAGISIVVVAALVVFFTSEDVQIGRRISSTQVESVREYIEDCVEDRVKEEVKSLKAYGGENGPGVPSSSFSYNGNPYNVLLESNDRNNLPSRDDVKNMIASDVRNYLTSGGCSLESFKDNFLITERRNEIDAGAEISDSEINVNFVYPITVERGDSKIELREFNLVIEDNLGYILQPLVLWIINGYLADSNFNLLGYCAENGYYCDPDNSGNGEKKIDIYNRPEDYESGNADNVFRFVVVT